MRGDRGAIVRDVAPGLWVWQVGHPDWRPGLDWDRWLGLGVIDVKNPEVEAPELVASRIRRALEYVPADRLMINPDCGLRHLAPDVARRKLRAMVAGAAQVRAELGETTR